MLKTIVCVLLFFLAACTTTGDVRNYCASVTTNFVDQVACIQNVVSQDSYMSGDSFVQEYVMTGRVLADQVRAGKLTENEARLAFTREYNQMILRQQQYNTYSALQWEALRPVQTVCRPVGNRTICDTY